VSSGRRWRPAHGRSRTGRRSGGLAGHEAIAVDLPGDDPSAGLPEYADLVTSAIGDRGNLVLVAMSLGGFTAPLVAAKVPVDALVFVNAMIPTPGETPGAWWDNTGWAEARVAAAEQGGYSAEFDLGVYFLHDVPPEVAAAGEPYQRPEADAVFGSACDFSAWPPVPIRAVAGADDRFFPVGFQQALARDRLGIEADVLPGGHLIALSQSARLASYLLGVCPGA
jgi:Alpha/beta hydrolase family